MSINPYSLEMCIGYNSKRISSDVINYYVSYMKDNGFSITAENITLVERILWESYPSGTTYQAWYTFDKDKSKDDYIKQTLTYVFTPLKIYNGTPEGFPLEIQGQQLPINELNGTTPEREVSHFKSSSV